MKNKLLIGLSLTLMIACGDKPAEQPSPKNPPPARTNAAAAKTKHAATKTVAQSTTQATKKKDTKKTVPSAKVAVTAEGVAELTINVTDSMKYNEQLFEVKAGQKVKLTLKHLGKLPKNAMGHNVVILKKGVNVKDFATAAQSAAATDFLPQDKLGSVIAYTKLIGGGESTTVEFTAPEPGTYTYICTYPGHWSVMKGEMVVK